MTSPDVATKLCNCETSGPDVCGRHVNSDSNQDAGTED